MNNKKKKKQNGFTIVELVIVIAVIGILAAVLIPTFSNLVKKSKQSADQQLVYHINEAVIANEVDNLAKGKSGTEATMYDTLKKLESDYGFTVEKMTPRSGNDIVWDSTTNRFALVAKDNKVVYTDPNRPTVDMTNKAQMWRITEAGETLGDGYSHYLTAGWTGTVAVTTGVDVGDNDDITAVTYDSSSDASAVVRTKGGTLTVIAPNGTVKHYGEAESVNVVAVANNSYHENGTVKFVEISKGRMALETGAEVNHIHINAKVVNDVKQDVFDNIIIAKANDVTMPDFSRDDVEIATAGTLVVALQTGTEEVTSQTKLDYVWLTKQGVYEQITVSDSATKATTTVGTQEQNVWVNTSNKPAETKTAAQQIANNIGTTATVGSNTYDVAVDETTRDIVLKETGTDTVAYTVTVEEGKTVVTTTGENPTTVEVEVVEAQPDKEDVQIGATYFAGGIGTENNPYLIATAEQFRTYQLLSKYRCPTDVNGSVEKTGSYMRYIFGDDYKTTYIKIVEDLDLNGEYSMPDFDGYSFMLSNVIIDGNGHTISNGNTRNRGFIADRWNGNVTVKNLIVENSDLCVGLFNTGYSDPDAGNILTLDNIVVKNSTANDSTFVCFPSNKHVEIYNSSVESGLVTFWGAAGSSGGFVGNGQYVKFDNCTFQGTIDAQTGCAGGLIGQAGTGVYITNCEIKTNTIIKTAATNGKIGALAYSNLTASNCSNNVFAGILQSAKKANANITGLDTTVYNLNNVWILYNTDITSEYVSFDATTGQVVYSGNNSYTTMVIEQRYNVDNLTNGEFYKGGFPRVLESVEVNDVSNGSNGNVSIINGLAQYVGEYNGNLGYSTHSNTNVPSKVDSFSIVNGKLYYNCGMSSTGTGNYISGTLNGNEPASINITVVVTMYNGENVVGSVSFVYSANLK